MKKVCIVGAGAIGSVIGARLAAAGQCDTSVYARGQTLSMLKQHGWQLKTSSSLVQCPARASDNAADLGCQDIVFIVVKGPALSAVAKSIAPLIGPNTIIVPAMNGVPWWFCKGIAGFGNEPLISADPRGDVARALPFERVLGCVVHASASQLEPGLAQEKMWQAMVLGEPSGGESARVSEVVDMLTRAGLSARASPDVRTEIWFKLWGNMTMNTVSALTGATIDKILGDP
ncbi:MAG: hypothetical protein RL291_465, partial [Pseudomonadota bacterium]